MVGTVHPLDLSPGWGWRHMPVAHLTMTSLDWQLLAVLLSSLNFLETKAMVIMDPKFTWANLHGLQTE